MQMLLFEYAFTHRQEYIFEHRHIFVCKYLSFQNCCMCIFEAIKIFSKENRKTEKKKKKAISQDRMQSGQKESE
jgi:hypothetical protein